MRVFLDFQGVLTSAGVTVEGTDLPHHVGGYLPFSHEVTDLLEPGGTGLVAVTVDGTWQDVPPGGSPDGPDAIDFMEPAGLTREVALRAVPETFLADVWAAPADVLDADRRRVEVTCALDAGGPGGLPLRLVARLWDGDTRLAETTRELPPDASLATLTLGELGPVRLWDVVRPALYQVEVVLFAGDAAVHRVHRRIGFREARFEADGFHLNGERLPLVGLNRHELFPYTGMAMPPRVQRRDARFLRHELNCTMVRCSHYPQSAAFLDACDELGLLVFQELPGWHYIGGRAWQDRAVAMAEEMVRRDRSRPSVVLWGTRINESVDSPLHERCERAVKALDPTRQTTGAMNLRTEEEIAGFDHDVFSFNDYQVGPDGHVGLRPPVEGRPYLVSEAVGQFPRFRQHYRRIDDLAVQQRQCVEHALAHAQAAADDRYAGVVGWAAFDYPSRHGTVYEALKWSGVADVFRVPKPGAAIYQSQVDPAVRPVLAPAFHWDFGPGSPAEGPGPDAMICSNCDRLEIYLDDAHHATAHPDRERFGRLDHPPSFVDLTVPGGTRPELRVDGYVGDRLVVSRRFGGDRAGDTLSLVADDAELVGDGRDATRVVFRVVDAHGAPRPYVSGDVELTLTGPGALVGDRPFPLGDNGGVGAVWVRTTPGGGGDIHLTARLAGYPEAVVRIAVAAPDPPPPG
jgi:beta-galactosidase